jgi:hypothetical protein
MAEDPPASDPEQQARFIFIGTVKQLGKATMSGVPVDKDTAVVRVEQVQAAPKPLAKYAGRDITVQLASPAKAKTGQRLLFFTKGWLFGESVAVKSLAQRPAPPTRLPARGLAASATLRASDPVEELRTRDLRSRVDSADVVVTGTVSSVRLPTGAASPAASLTRDAGPGQPMARPPASEHDPQWQEAVVDVEAVHKGQPQGQKIVVRFPSSMDVMWHRAPKFRPGQKGVFVLHKQEKEAPRAAAELALAAGAAAPTEAYTALSPMDFQPSDQPGARARTERVLAVAEPADG